MYCIHCGKELPDDAKFCLNCGAAVESAAPGVQCGVCGTPAAETETKTAVAVPQREMAAMEVYDKPAEPEGTPSAVKVMVLGIVALALSEFGIPGIILACIARSNARKREAAVGPLTRMAKVGNILSRVALPVSIAFTVFWAIYFIVVISGVLFSVSVYNRQMLDLFRSFDGLM